MALRKETNITQMNKASAIVMAGYNNKWAVRKYAKIVAEHYGETFIETGYKPLREFEVLENGQPVNKPLIQFTLEQLFRSNRIGDVTPFIQRVRPIYEQHQDSVPPELVRRIRAEAVP